ncbi:ABC transporter permease [Saccharothrix violaceirubra]|uniref:Peptide/nickel transport system permease protein n=1 Tax=Saccharothrix violaceirubra TaxID=413306 RepID=A0A7W7T8M0_9PSEU|nr:ABC transporter permease [Saccharothrix violaceirubra]MBB4967305.1 peptide/nickel transport system permease protein [Saccharothrix violaceirubra]
MIRRLAAAIPVLLAVLTLAFLAMRLVPGDPVETMLAAGPPPTPEQEQALRHQLGLDRPVVEQYLDFLADAAHGDFGRSVRTGEPVGDVIAAVAPASVELAVAALVLALVFGVGIALLGRATRLRWLRAVCEGVPVVAMSTPGYWVALVLIEVFSFRLPLFPASGDHGFAALVLPAITVALPAIGVFAQVLGAGLAAVDAEAFVLTARAKGAGRWRVLLRHALRNASIPTITLVGTTVGNLLAAAVVAETVFARPGLGRVTLTAVTTHDLPVLQGVVALLGLLYVVVNLLVDVCYVLVDPRVTADRIRG